MDGVQKTHVWSAVLNPTAEGGQFPRTLVILCQLLDLNLCALNVSGCVCTHGRKAAGSLGQNQTGVSCAKLSTRNLH